MRLAALADNASQYPFVRPRKASSERNAAGAIKRPRDRSRATTINPSGAEEQRPQNVTTAYEIYFDLTLGFGAAPRCTPDFDFIRSSLCVTQSTRRSVRPEHTHAYTHRARLIVVEINSSNRKPKQPQPKKSLTKSKTTPLPTHTHKHLQHMMNVLVFVCSSGLHGVCCAVFGCNMPTSLALFFPYFLLEMAFTVRK